MFVGHAFESLKSKEIWLLFETMSCPGDIEGRLESDVQAAMCDREDSNNAFTDGLGVQIGCFMSVIS